MRRRSFVKTAAAGLLVSGAAPAAALRRAKRRLKMVTSWPRGLPGLATSAQRVARSIEAATDGRIAVAVHAAGELAGPFETLDVVGSGDADMYHSADYYQAARSPAFNFFTAVPFGLTADEMAAWLLYGGGQELWDEVSATFNIKPFMCTSTGTQMGGWFNREIRSIDDFEGLKIRMPGLGGEVLKRLGAVPVNVAGGEVHTALSEGRIDAAEWVGPWNDLAARLHEVASHYYYPAFHEPGGMLALGINRDIWETFSAFEQEAIRHVTTAEYTRSLAEFNARNAEAIAVLRREHGIVPKGWSEDVLSVLAALSGEVVEELAAADELTSRVYQSYSKARQAALSWGAIGQEAFTAARRLERRA